MVELESVLNRGDIHDPVFVGWTALRAHVVEADQVQVLARENRLAGCLPVLRTVRSRHVAYGRHQLTYMLAAGEILVSPSVFPDGDVWHGTV